MLPSAQSPAPASRAQEIAPGVYWLEVGKGIMRSNVYFVRSGPAWALIDTASARCEGVIQAAAEFLFGADTPPAAILLTHDHPDHAGSALALAWRWGCRVYVHPDELPLVTMTPSTYLPTVEKYAAPLDRWVILPLLRLLPERTRAAALAGSSFKQVARPLEEGTRVPGLADWEYTPTPGHTPGHVSFFRRGDRVLLTGDAILTAELNSVGGALSWIFARSQPQLAGPPWYSTWSWPTARASVARLAALEPCVVAGGHGFPVSGSRTAAALRALAAHI